jgi:hypothetical protein
VDADLTPAGSLLRIGKRRSRRSHAWYDDAVKRTTLIFFNIMAAMSLFLCVTGAALWVRSYWVVDNIAWNGARAAITLSTSDCTLEIWHLSGRLDICDGWSHTSSPNDRPEYIWGWYEFRTDGQFKIAIPFWLICLVTAFHFATWMIVRRIHRWRRARRSAHPGSLCSMCSYDLRATPERCPECGTAPATGAGRRGVVD